MHIDVASRRKWRGLIDVKIGVEIIVGYIHFVDVVFEVVDLDIGFGFLDIGFDDNLA